MALTPEQQAFATGLIDGASCVFENADRLFYEAGVLADVNAFSRGYLLHQISLEECGKIEMLCAAITSCLAGEDVNVKSLSRTFRRHEGKNKMNAYFLSRTEEEKSAEDDNNIAAAKDAFKKVQEDFHQESNRLKNSSLYVDFDGVFISPQEIISKEDYEKIREMNKDFMTLASHKVKMLSLWRTDLDAAVDDIQGLKSLLIEVRQNEKSPVAALEALLEIIKKAVTKPQK
ncbi:AbiV family abortive infection protein [Pseudomonas fluorescens]|uniref:AbiV family abortive infection protein n=1 Tax=Pseudomonas fluorescens TaxID=294 RepID=UPI002735D141|nr:AbiV family abortive infection protein [Pseudomonas fluorescens]WLH72527.1 AbiV family abortive infection protein [Pseudomonas fluorescens]